MIGSGQVTFYLQEWRNLYRYSQQGCWEALNSTKVMVSPETVSLRQFPNGCSGGYTFFLVDTKTLNMIEEYFT
jgi:hypothetical protein